MGSYGPQCVHFRFWDMRDPPLVNAGTDNPGIVEMHCYLRCPRILDDEKCLEKTLGVKLWDCLCDSRYVWTGVKKLKVRTVDRVEEGPGALFWGEIGKWDIEIEEGCGRSSDRSRT